MPTSLSVTTFRVVQFTPPGSPSSIHFGKGRYVGRAGLGTADTISSSPTSRRRAPSSSVAAST